MSQTKKKAAKQDPVVLLACTVSFWGQLKLECRIKSREVMSEADLGDDSVIRVEVR